MSVHRYALLMMSVTAIANAALSRDASAQSFTITLDNVQYTLPWNELYPPTTGRENGFRMAAPYVHHYEYMRVVIKDRELFNFCRSLYKAKPGDKVEVLYGPIQVVVNGKTVPEPQESASAAC